MGRWVGEGSVAELLALAGDGRPREVLEDERLWSSYRQKIALFEAAATLTGDADVARKIGESVLAEQLGGVVRAVIGALGSPQRVLRSVAGANAKFSTGATMRALAVSVGQATIAYRLHPEHVPSRHDCLYTQGVLSQVTVLFGLPPAAIVHEECQVEGAHACTYEVSWPRWRWWMRRVGRRGSDVADVPLHERIKDLERTVVDLVAVDDLEHALERIASRAGAAVHAQRHLLAARIGRQEFVYADGLAHEEAHNLGRELLKTGSVHRHASIQLVAPIVSARRQYGWLAAFLPADGGFLPAEQEHLEAYAGLAAAALDVASSLQEARRSGQVSEALLLLGRQLAREADEGALANRVAEAVPLVSGAGRARVMLWSASAQRLTTAAAVGFGSQTEPALGFEIARLRLLDAARHAATHDHLTGLAGRALFGDRIERALADGRRTARSTAVCFRDLDGFKLVNDTHGHAAGDAALVEVARRLQGIVRDTDTVLRAADGAMYRAKQRGGGFHLVDALPVADPIPVVR